MKFKTKFKKKKKPQKTEIVTFWYESFQAMKNISPFILSYIQYLKSFVLGKK